jgi:catalase
MITPQQMVESINAVFGRHAGFRALHAKGLWCRGTFVATPEAAQLTRAAHMQGEPVDVTVRFSNGSGDPASPDYADDVRGMAVTFHLPDGSRTDILGQTARRAPVRTPDEFIALVRAAAAPQRLPLYLAKHPHAIRALAANLPVIGPPASFATRAYYPLHAFRWVNADGAGRSVRYTWLPEAGDEGISRKEAKRRGRNYLQEEIGERLGRGPVRFTLQLQLAEEGDKVDDPMSVWPDQRTTVVAGTLEVTGLTDDPESGGDILVFDPVRVTDGIEPSNDPILNYRPRAYSVSVDQRAAPAERPSVTTRE